MGRSKVAALEGEAEGAVESASEWARALVVVREIAGFSQRELAEKIGVSEKLLSRWSRGKSQPDAEELARYLAALGLTLAAYELVVETVRAVDLVRASTDEAATESALAELYADRTALIARELVRALLLTRAP